MSQAFQYLGGGIVPVFDIEEFLITPVQILAASAGTIVTYPQGSILAESVANPGQFGLYDSTNSDLNVAKGVTAYPFTVDENGKIGFSTTQAYGAFGQVYGNAPLIIKGYIRTEDVSQVVGPGGITAAAVSALGRLISGTRAAGIWRLY